jgi:hypothetical protein
MTLHLELEVPYPGETLRFGYLASFVRVAESSGVDDDHLVTGVAVDNTDDILKSLRVDLDATTLAASPRQVAIPRVLAERLLRLLHKIGSGDGDVRALQSIVTGHYEELAAIVTAG